MPTTPAALEILHARGVTVVPDFIANAGGVIAAAHSMDARYSPFPVDPDDVFAMISTKMRQNTLTVVDRGPRPQPDHPRGGPGARPGTGPDRDDAAGTDPREREVT